MCQYANGNTNYCNLNCHIGKLVDSFTQSPDGRYRRPNLNRSLNRYPE